MFDQKSKNKFIVSDFHRTVRTALVQEIRDEILRGTYTPGSHLRLEELAGRFAVSTMPVRDALRTLEAEGIVTSVAHKGTFVTQYSAVELEDIYEMRASLEQMATRSAVPLMTPEDLALLHQYNADFNQHQGDLARMSQINNTFHKTLYAVSGRRHLCDMILRLRYSTHHYLNAYVVVLEGVNRTIDDHQAIIDACATGNAEEVADLVYKHVWHVGLAIADYVRFQMDKD